jgi:mannitol-1-phosphate 5-dehydrogenase
MDRIQQNKLVLFGAGKIGRSFIGQLFSTGGYEVVFIDINKQIIDALNKSRRYNIIIKSDKEEIIEVHNVRGIYADDYEKVVHETSTAGIVAISVGSERLENIFPVLAQSLLIRKEIDRNYPLDIIIAENLRNADTCFQNKLKSLLPDNYPFENLVGLIETSIGKMVPIIQKKDLRKDILQVFAEPYNTLILNKKGFRNPIPAINGLAPKENMKAWVDRKLFIHNLGHSAAAYLGYMHNQNYIYLYEVLSVRDVFCLVRETMQQAADILMAKYPGEFTLKLLNEHIDDLLFRFQNKALGDTVFRVGCDLMRKLGPEDRLAGAIKAALELDLPYNKILFALVSGFHFRAADEDGNMLPGDREFVKIYQKGIKFVLTEICGFDRSKEGHVIMAAEEIDKSLISEVRN